MDWKTISAAYDLVAAGTVSRADGDGWKVYRAGAVIRIDITAPATQ